MANKVQKVREEVERLIEQTKPYLGACAGQVVAEANNKIAAYNEVLGILNFMQEEPVSEDLEKAASRYAKEEYNHKIPATLPDRCRGCYAPLMYAFKAGANWQREQFEKNRLKHCDSITNEQAELEQGFIEQHLDKYNRMPTFLDAIKYGMNLQKEQMIANAVGGTTKFVGEGAEKMVKFVCPNLNPDEYWLNQRVKLIIIKKD